MADSRVAFKVALVAAWVAACAPSPAPEVEESASAAGEPSGSPAPSAAAAAGPSVEWPFYGGNLASQRYSPLEQIDASNVDQLKVAWRFATGNYGPRPEARNENTPLDDRRCAVSRTPASRAMSSRSTRSAASCSGCGAPNDGEERFDKAPRKTSGRGLAYWTDGAGNERAVHVTPGFYLVALDRATRGAPCPASATNGIVDLRSACAARSTTDLEHRQLLPALVVGDVVIVGAAHEVGVSAAVEGEREGRRARLRRAHGQAALDVQTIPERGEPRLRHVVERLGQITGNAGVWAPMTGDAELGYVYLPIEAALADRTAATATAPICSARASSCSTRRPASACGITS